MYCEVFVDCFDCLLMVGEMFGVMVVEVWLFIDLVCGEVDMVF